MGKAGRRKKNRQRRKQQQQQQQQHVLSGDGDDAVLSSISSSAYTTTTTNNNQHATIVNPQSAVQRLRHADPKIRHAALVALQASVLSQARSSHKPVSLKVLQAVREQVASNDLECSAVAADCLAQYLLSISSSSNNKNYSGNRDDPQKQTIASWALVLLGRLDDCRKALEEQQQQLLQRKQQRSVSKNQLKKAEKTKKRWYAVAAPCLIALCQLIEDNGHALDQINLQKKTFVGVVFGLLSLECVNIRSAKHNNKHPGANFDDETTMKDEGDEVALQQQQQQQSHDVIFAKLRDTTALYSARCLHSALDDNWELAQALDYNGGGENQQQVWINLLKIPETETNEGEGRHLLSTTTRLHLIGCLVNLYQFSLHDDSTNDLVSYYEKAIMEFGISASRQGGGGGGSSEGLLLEVLLSSHTSGKSDNSSMTMMTSRLDLRLAETEARYRTAQALLEKQQRDQQLEEEINAKVKERKEPAKLIAKRQKKSKEAKREAFREQQKAKMIAEAESSTNDAEMMDASDDEEKEKDDDESQEVIKSGTIVREQDGEEAKNEAILEWISTTGPIQLGLEIFANLVSTWIAPQGGEDGDDPMVGVGGGETNAKSSEIYRFTHGQNMTSRLAQTFQTLTRFLGKSQGSALVPPDDPIRNDAEETIEKVSAFVTNCFLSGIVDANEEMWEVVFSEVRTELGHPTPSAMVLDAGSSILAVAAEMNPTILRSSCNKSRGEQLAVFQRLLPRAEAVCLLSSHVLLEAASAESEATIRCLTETFLALLRPISSQSESVNPKTQTSILKAFMDWYGNDEFHPHLYESLGVSEAINWALESIANDNQAAKVDLDQEQLQILHNSGRFLEYKKQLGVQLRSR